jgi:GT2 family glycosyltransferase
MSTRFLTQDVPAPHGKQGWPWSLPPSAEASLLEGEGTWPRITVVTPSFNQAAYLEETVRSVLLQGYPNLEYIVMDGGSTDGSVEIIEKYSPWIAYWQSCPDGGQASAINAGWRRAGGELLTWLNSDDILMPRSLEAAACVLLAREAPAEMVYGDVILIDETSAHIRVRKAQHFHTYDVLVRAVNPAPQPGFLMRRSVFERVGPLDEALHFAMDFDYWVRMALEGVRPRYIRQSLAGFRQHPASKTSTQHLTRIRDRYRIAEKVVNHPHLPPDIRAHLVELEAHVELNAAYIAYRAADMREARLHAGRHIRMAKHRSSVLALAIFARALLSWS